MPGLRGIDNIRKAMERRERERDESLKLALEIEREEVATRPEASGTEAPCDLERRLAERLADQRRAAEERAAAWRAGASSAAFSASRFIAAAVPRKPEEPAASNPAPPALPRARDGGDDLRPLPRQQEVLDAIRTARPRGRTRRSLIPLSHHPSVDEQPAATRACTARRRAGRAKTTKDRWIGNLELRAG